MLKKMMLLALSVGALVAFSVPAVAQADVFLTEQVGDDKVPLEEGADITATATESLITTTANGTLECELVTLHYTVLVNGPDHVVLDPMPDPHNATTKDCALNIGVAKIPAIISNAGTEQLTINTWGTGETTATFTSEIPAVGLHCVFEGDVHVQGAASGTDLLNVTPSPLVGTGPGCPENGLIEGVANKGTFTLETEDGEAVTLDFVETE